MWEAAKWFGCLSRVGVGQVFSGDVKRYGRACKDCQKGGLAEVPMGEMPIHKVPFENVAIDIVGMFPRSHGYKYILTYICLASRAIPLKHATCTRVCRSPIGNILAEWGSHLTA